MNCKEYMKMRAELIPDEFIKQYNLNKNIFKRYIWIHIIHNMYRLLQVRILFNKLLWERLAKDGYPQMPHTTGLWKHIYQPVQFTLVIDDLGVKYIGKGM